MGDGMEDTEGYEDAVQRVEGHIVKLLQRHPKLRRDRIVVGGFSQGAVVALSTLLRSHERLAGIIMLSGYLPQRELLENMLNETGLNFNRRTVPVLMCHGTQDKLVQFKWGKLSAKLMKGNGMDIHWKT